jgi:hypothetical protein
VLRIKPPIIITKQDIEGFLVVLKELLVNYHNNGLKRSESIEAREEAMNGIKKLKS